MITRTFCSWLSSICLLCVLSFRCMGTTISSLDDIHFWVGNGGQRAALVLDWQGDSITDESLVWGYRWDGIATGEDLLRAVLAADTRLYAKLSPPGPAGIAVYGYGYDANNDSQFAITDGTVFDMDGVAVSGPSDGAGAEDPQDLYAEGWVISGYWNYSVSGDNPFDGGSWVASNVGAASHTLSDGDWNGWAHTPTFNFSASPANPQAAVAPLTADFNLDGRVDGCDFLIWQLGFGITSGAQLSQGDANADGAVNHLDLQQWSDQYGSLSPPTNRLSAATVPEPNSTVLALLALTFLFSETVFTPRRMCS